MGETNFTLDNLFFVLWYWPSFSHVVPWLWWIYFKAGLCWICCANFPGCSHPTTIGSHCAGARVQANDKQGHPIGPHGDILWDGWFDMHCRVSGSYREMTEANDNQGYRTGTLWDGWFDMDCRVSGSYREMPEANDNRRQILKMPNMELHTRRYCTWLDIARHTSKKQKESIFQLLKYLWWKCQFLVENHWWFQF